MNPNACQIADPNRMAMHREAIAYAEQRLRGHGSWIRVSALKSRVSAPKIG